MSVSPVSQFGRLMWSVLMKGVHLLKNHSHGVRLVKGQIWTEPCMTIETSQNVTI